MVVVSQHLQTDCSVSYCTYRPPTVTLNVVGPLVQLTSAGGRPLAAASLPNWSVVVRCGGLSLAGCVSQLRIQYDAARRPTSTAEMF